MQRVFKEDDIVWRKMPMNDEVSYYVVTKDIIRPDRVSAISLLNGTEGIINTKELTHFWIQKGDFLGVQDCIVKVLEFRHRMGVGSPFCITIEYIDGGKDKVEGIGVFDVDANFMKHIQIL